MPSGGFVPGGINRGRALASERTLPASSPPLDVTLARSVAGGPDAEGEGEVPGSLAIHSFELSLPRVTLDDLDRASRHLDEAWLRVRSLSDDTEEVVVLSTCHRVELYVVLRSSLGLKRWSESLPVDRAAWKLRSGREAVRHLFRVAVGLESMVPGEADIRHQVRAAGRGGLSRSPRPILRDLFGRAAQAADLLAPPGSSASSVASLAAERLVARLGPARPRVVVLGAGMAGKRVLESLGPAAELCVVFHDRPPQPALIAKLGARAVPRERLAEELEQADALVCASRATSYCVGPEHLPKGRNLLVVDLGVPRNVDPSVRAIPGLELWDLEDLWRARSRGPAGSSLDLAAL